jgi:hypothetical protein
MDFDHVGDDKILDISHMRRHNLDKLRAEIAKCEVVCACCHRIRTFTRLGLMDQDAGVLSQEIGVRVP